MYSFEKVINDSVKSLRESRETQYNELIRPYLTQQQVEQFAMNAILDYLCGGRRYELDNGIRIKAMIQDGSIPAENINALMENQLDTASLKTKLQDIADGKDA